VVIILGQWFLGYTLDLFPLWGYGSVKYLLLPVVIGTLCGIGANVRFFRTVFVDELKKEYLRTAVAKGASSFQVYFKHLLRNAGLQIITRASAGLPFLFTGSLLLESFFGIPGLGFAGVDALYNSDIQLLKAIVVLSAFLFVFINLLADLAYAWADPRIRLE
jgi:peptide/nickel transport system permease protein